jgi:hypothetical protein
MKENRRHVRDCEEGDGGRGQDRTTAAKEGRPFNWQRVLLPVDQ